MIVVLDYYIALFFLRNRKLCSKVFALEKSHEFFPLENWLIFSITASQKSMNKQGSNGNIVPLQNKDTGRLAFVQFPSCLQCLEAFKRKKKM